MKFIKIFWKHWRAFGKKLGTIQTYILYGLFYILFISIPCIISRFFFDPLGLKEVSKKSNFGAWQGKKETLSDARMQF